MSEASKLPASGRRPTPVTVAGSSLESAAQASSKAGAFVGQTVDERYVVDRVLGEGGMGIVYAGHHKVIGKKVAIKVLRSDLAADRDATDRFLQEARAASAIGNPHIVDINDFGQLADGSTYFVMELVDGKSLSEVLAEAQGPIALDRLCRIAKQIAVGLAAAHAADIVHRDLKPDNVMLVDRGVERDVVKILDFGIAKVGSAANRVTQAGCIFGTPHYMSPEQAAGAPVDKRTDVYALGVILYEMASGKVPFDADNYMGILTQHMYKSPVPIRALVPEVDVPPGLDAIVLKSLTKKAEGRYTSMDELIEDIERLERGVLPRAVHEMMSRSGGFNVPADYFRSSVMPAPVPASPALPRERWPLYAVIGAVATIVAVMALVLVGRASGTPAQTPPPAQAATTVPAAPAAYPPPVAPAAAPSSPSPSVPLLHEVLVSVAPLDATITRDGSDLGGAPVALHLADGETAVLVVSRKGYKTRTVTVDGNDTKVTLSLESAVTPPPARAAGAPGKRPASRAMDDVGDPFATRDNGRRR
jgi:serine/threonine-protein kinase